MPESFFRIQLGGVGRKIVDFDIFPILSKPLISLRFLMIGSIVLDQVNPLGFFIILRPEMIFQKFPIGFGI